MIRSRRYCCLRFCLVSWSDSRTRYLQSDLTGPYLALTHHMKWLKAKKKGKKSNCFCPSPSACNNWRLRCMLVLYGNSRMLPRVKVALLSVSSDSVRLSLTLPVGPIGERTNHNPLCHRVRHSNGRTSPQWHGGWEYWLTQGDVRKSVGRSRPNRVSSEMRIQHSKKRHGGQIYKKKSVRFKETSPLFCWKTKK